MGHPLVGNLQELTNDELQTKYTELTKRIATAYRLGYGDAVHQLNMMLEDYQFELRRRQEKMLQELTEKSAEFKHIIDIS